MRCACDNTQWYEDQEDIDMVAKQCDLYDIEEMRIKPYEPILAFHPRGMSLVQEELVK